MTRRLSLVALVGLLAGLLAAPVFAAPRPGRLVAINGFRAVSTTTGTSITGSATDLAAVNLTCGGTACTIAFYDLSGLSGAADAVGKFEVNAAANTTVFVDLTDTRIRFTSGIMAQSNGVAGTVTAYRVE